MKFNSYLLIKIEIKTRAELLVFFEVTHTYVATVMTVEVDEVDG